MKPLRFALASAQLVGLLAGCSSPLGSIPPALSLPVPPGRTEAPPTATAAPSASARAPDVLDLAAVDAWVARKVQEQHLVGLSLAIVRDGKIVLAKGYGRASLDPGVPVETTTAFAIGSVTKQFTCAAALLLEEAGKLSLSDKVAKYYPELPRAKEITLADLGGHTSGYPDYYPLDFFDSRMTRGISPDDLIHKYAAAPLDFAPRERWSYSNTGFVILGRVIEKVSGQPFGQFVTDRLLRRVGMDHASFAPAPAPASQGLAIGYESFALSDPQPAPREPESWLYAAGAMYASATDLAKWDLALVDGRVLKPREYAEMTSPRPLRDKRSSMYGCGLSVTQMRGDTVLSHGGEVNGFLAQNGVVPRTRSAVVLLTNSQFGDPAGIYRTLLALVVKDGAPGAKPPTVPGSTMKDAGLAMLRQLQSGTLDRGNLGAEFNLFMTDARLREATARLSPFGEPTGTDVDGPFERGGMEVSQFHFSFHSGRLDALMYRTPDGKVQEFLVFRP